MQRRDSFQGHQPGLEQESDLTSAPFSIPWGMLLLLFKYRKNCPFPGKWRAKRMRSDINSDTGAGGESNNNGTVPIKTLFLGKVNV